MRLIILKTPVPLFGTLKFKIKVKKTSLFEKNGHQLLFFFF